MVRSERNEVVLEAFVEKGVDVGLVVLGYAQDLEASSAMMRRVVAVGESEITGRKGKKSQQKERFKLLVGIEGG